MKRYTNYKVKRVTRRMVKEYQNWLHRLYPHFKRSSHREEAVNHFNPVNHPVKSQLFITAKNQQFVR